MTDDSLGGDTHPDLDRLADLDAGLETGTDLAAHVSACDECRAALAALRATGADLGAMPLPDMPADVVARVDAALETEREHGTKAGTVVPLDINSRNRRRGGLLAGGVAAAVIAALVVALTLNATDSNNDGAANSAAAPGAASLGTSGIFSVHTTGTNYTQAKLGSQVSALLHSPVAFAGHTSTSGSANGPVGATTQSVPSPSNGTTRQTHDAHAPTVTGGSGAIAGVPALPSQLDALKTTPSAMAQCINTLLQGEKPVAPLAVDLARFQGKASAIFVFPKANDPTHVRVYVVPPDGCTSGIFSFFLVPK